MSRRNRCGNAAGLDHRRARGLACGLACEPRKFWHSRGFGRSGRVRRPKYGGGESLGAAVGRIGHQDKSLCWSIDRLVVGLGRRSHARVDCGRCFAHRVLIARGDRARSSLLLQRNRHRLSKSPRFFAIHFHRHWRIGRPCGGRRRNMGMRNMGSALRAVRARRGRNTQRISGSIGAG